MLFPSISHSTFPNQDDVIAERAPQPLAPAPVQAAAPKSKPVPECPHVLSHWVKGPQGQVKCEVLTKRRALGKGGFAVVYEMHRTEDGRPYACKVVSKESLIKPRARQKLETEVLIHEAVDVRHRPHLHTALYSCSLWLTKKRTRNEKGS